MKMEIYSMDATDFTQHANQVKEILLDALERDGLLKESAANIAVTYAVVVSKPGWLGSLWKRLTNNKDDKQNLRYDVVKSV